MLRREPGATRFPCILTQGESVRLSEETVLGQASPAVYRANPFLWAGNTVASLIQ